MVIYPLTAKNPANPMIKNWTATDESVVKPYTLAIKDEKCSLLLSNRFAVLENL